MSRNIEIDGKRFSLEWLSDREDVHAQRLLESNLHKATIYCHCSGRAQPLYVSHKGFRYYYLAKQGNTGALHHRSCDFWEQDTDDAQGRGKAKPARVLRADGMVDIKLDCPLVRHQAKQSSPAKATSGGTRSRSSRSSWTLLGLLQDLWSEAQLNAWFPRRRSPPAMAEVRRKILDEMTSRIVAGHKLDDIAFIPEYFDNFAVSEQANSIRLTNLTDHPDRAALVIGVLAKVVSSKFEDGGKGLMLRLMKERLWMTPEQTKGVEKSFARQLAGVDSATRKIIVICTVFRSNSTLKVGNVEMMTVSPEFIPADSDYELQVIDKLISEGRRFDKPIRLENDFVPDFKLRDTYPNTVMEVFGMMNDPEYARHAAEKLRSYAQSGIPTWQWNTALSREIPEFPAKTVFPTTQEEE